MFCFNGKHDERKERSLANRVSLTAVAYRERWHRDEQVHEVLLRLGFLAVPKQRGTWMSEECGPHSNVIGPCTSIRAASIDGWPSTSSPLKNCVIRNEKEREVIFTVEQGA